ncbi:MAG: hypothetical protein KDB27_14300 [Planctomycetales bacterium]|nr:hypothetical protein [Planctomycetales bacterium]
MFSNAPVAGGGGAGFVRTTALSFIMLPIVLLDVLVFSNRILGPIHRLKLKLTELANGNDAEQIELRSKDYCHDVINEFNAVVARLKKERHEHSDSSKTAISQAETKHEEPVPV